MNRLKKFNQLHEGKSEENDFVSKVTDTLINDENISGYENIVYIETKECTVKWDYIPVEASWGISHFLPKITSVTIEVEIYTYNEETEKDESTEKEYSFDILTADIDTESENSIQKLPFAPSEIEFSHLETSKDNKVQIKIIF